MFVIETNKLHRRLDAVDLKTFLTYKPIFRLKEKLKRLHVRVDCTDFDALSLNDFDQLE